MSLDRRKALLFRHWEKTNEAIKKKTTLFLSKNKGLAKNRYYHEIGRKKIRRVVCSDPEKLIGQPMFDTFSFLLTSFSFVFWQCQDSTWLPP